MKPALQLILIMSIIWVLKMSNCVTEYFMEFFKHLISVSLISFEKLIDIYGKITDLCPFLFFLHYKLKIIHDCIRNITYL